MLETVVVGSLPKPGWLAPRTERALSWRLGEDLLAEGMDDAVRLALADQEEAGLDAVTDGEERRRHYIWGFCEGLSGIDFSSLVQIVTRGGRYGSRVPAPRIVGPLRRLRPVMVDALRFARAHTSKPVKVTLPGPMTCADSVADEHYGSRRELAEAFAAVLNEEACELAEAGCAVVQFDEPCFNIYLDELEDWGLDTLQRAAHGVRAATGVHICYGYGIPAVLAWKTRNTDWTHYERSLPLLRTSTIDQISVECAASGVDPAVLAGAAGKDLLVGVIDVGTEDVETPETVAGRIRAVLPHVAPERLHPSTDCGLVPRSREAARGKMRALAEGARLVREELTRAGRSPEGTRPPR